MKTVEEFKDADNRLAKAYNLTRTCLEELYGWETANGDDFRIDDDLRNVISSILEQADTALAEQ